MKQVELYGSDALIEFLRNARAEGLHLEDVKQSDRFIKCLCDAIVDAPILTELDLGKSHLRVESYQALLTLIDNNYRLKKVHTSLPEDASLEALHKQLTTRLEQSGLQRFQARTVDYQEPL